MKKIIFLILMLLTVMLFTISVSALSPGDPMGWVLYTDIVAYINGVPIHSYNIEGYTYVVAEELADYGFHVTWDDQDADGVLHITSGDGIICSSYVPQENTHRTGEVAMPYFFTNILTIPRGSPFGELI